MSGIEAVGLVLGIIPLVISALEHYQDGKGAVYTWRRHARVVQSLVRNLKTEQGKLYNTCETLLGGIVSPTELEPMLHAPFGPLWQNEHTNRRIEGRLDHMYNTFQETVTEMLDIMEEIKSNLGLNAQGQPEWRTSGTVKRISLRASLVIKRSSYDQALQSLISKNQTLETIVIGSLRLEPSRGKRSRGKYLESFRRVASSVYKALQLDLCGACSRKHRMCLQLHSPQLNLRGDEESIIGSLDFRVILSHHTVELTNLSSLSWIWREVKLRVDVPSEIQKGGFTLPRPSSIEVIRGNRTAKRVRIYVEEGSQNTTSHDISNKLQEAKSTMLLTPSPKLMNGNLCQALSTDNVGPMVCGYVMDPSVKGYGRLAVSRINDIRDNCELSFVSIRDMMETSVHWFQGSTPSLPQKLGLSSVVASGILQLQNTPWLSTIMTSRTVYVAKFDDVASFNRAYISRAAPEDPSHRAPICPGPSGDSFDATTPAELFGNELMWALFVLLIEVILWKPMDSILAERFGAHISGLSPSQIFDCTTERGFEITRGLLSRVTMVAGQEYCDAVDSCRRLGSSHPYLDLGREELRQQIYSNIITLIEESYESSKTLAAPGNGRGYGY